MTIKAKNIWLRLNILETQKLIWSDFREQANNVSVDLLSIDDPQLNKRIDFHKIDII